MQPEILRIGVWTCTVVLSLLIIRSAHAQSATVCDAYARNYAKDASRQGQVLGGGVVGSVIGLGIGVATGGAAAGAAIGGGVGVIAGGSRRQKDAEKIYRAAYQDCMAGRVR